MAMDTGVAGNFSGKGVHADHRTLFGFWFLVFGVDNPLAQPRYLEVLALDFLFG